MDFQDLSQKAERNLQEGYGLYIDARSAIKLPKDPVSGLRSLN